MSRWKGRPKYQRPQASFTALGEVEDRHDHVWCTLDQLGGSPSWAGRTREHFTSLPPPPFCLPLLNWVPSHWLSHTLASSPSSHFPVSQLCTRPTASALRCRLSEMLWRKHIARELWPGPAPSLLSSDNSTPTSAWKPHFLPRVGFTPEEALRPLGHPIK